ncbi:MAG: hypothetical protein VBE63_08195 [Lamprobacter sp.]|uniref:phage fiber-tail adaptor protein n=1 Tax=Lamprobacter sp. TaxID=3100796 RepID=UPI002B25F8C1|nr:hypothetical protein [Lamprobacter sp.]MEA3639909.1 hypothetical protein [Lamprobacter sp.]
MRLGAANQQPGERLSYTVWYNDALTVSDNALESSVTVEPAGELVISEVQTLADRARFWVSGGVSGTQYKVTISTSTEEGRVFEDELIFRIQEI